MELAGEEKQRIVSDPAERIQHCALSKRSLKFPFHVSGAICPSS
jgi:hypothetical protein